MDVGTLYQEIILDHARSPHHSGLRDPYGAEVHHVNPTCGDEVTLRVRLQDGVVADVSYLAEGCAISKASTSVLTDLLIGRALEDAVRITDEFVAVVEGRDGSEPDEETLGDGVALAGVAQFPARVKCALLGWMAWKDAAAQAVGDESESDESE